MSPRRLEIASIAPGGDGLAHVLYDDRRRAVFVPRSAPGDVVEAEIDWTRKPARGKVLRLLEASPLRAEPPCPVVERCGGCDLMHLALSAQMEAHREIVRDALGRAIQPARADGQVSGRSGSPPADGVGLPPIEAHPAVRDAGYRTRARLAIRAERGRVTAGYRQSSSHVIEDIAHCWVLDPRLDVVFAQLRDLFAGERGQGEASVALGRRDRPVLEIRWNGDLGGSFFAALGSLVEKGTWSGAEVWLEGASTPARFGEPAAVTQGPDGEPLIVPSGAFAQAHPAMNATLGERLLAAIELAGQPALELFSGSGNFTVLLARHTASLTAVESEPRAVAAARANLASRGLAARVVSADADAFDIPSAVRTIVLDPPRTGAPGAAQRIARSKARRVAYVSCDVSTLARDVATLEAGGLRLSKVETFEMFPHTSHVEVLAVLDRGARAKSSGGTP